MGAGMNMAKKEKTQEMEAGAEKEGMEGLDDKKRLKEEKKRLKAEQKAQKKEAKRRARELDDQEEELEESSGGSGPVVIVTFIIVVIWIAILALLIKLDVGGFGSTVLRPILQNVPVVNKVLPEEKMTVPGSGGEEEEY